jgi:excisionase family DNA binding protein
MSTGTGQMVELGAEAGAPEAELGDGLEYMTAEELARRLRMTPAWVYNETRAGRIPHLKLRRYVRYRRSTILAWEREQERCA